MRPLFCIIDQNLRDLVGHHFEYDGAAAAGARARGFEPICLGHRDAIDTVAQALPLRRAFSRSMWWLPENEDRDAAAAAANALFLQELEAGLAGEALGPDSVVFGHMIVHGQLPAWAEFVAKGAADGPQVILLLRYQPHFYTGAACEQAFRRLEVAVADGRRVRLASDSARLAGQIERLTRLPVEVFPIPHTSELHRTAQRSPGGPLRVVSLGNARDEKGILELFDAARILHLAGEGDGFEFVFQVNDPNADIAPAVARFVADPPPNVRLVREALSTQAYGELLASADIVATPYWRSIYEARTSGVFAEAVAAGKPVVCTAETWMSDELAEVGAGVVTPDRDAPALAGALSRARTDFAALDRKARADQPRWEAFHNPARFIEVLLDGAPPARKPIERRVALLFPWGDDLDAQSSGAASRVGPLLDVLATQAEKVRVLQDTERPARRVGAISYETFPMLVRAERRAWFRWARRGLKLLGARNGEEIFVLLYLAAARDPEFEACIDEIVGWADLVLLDYPFWAEPVRRACDRHGKAMVMTLHDVISDQCRSSPLLLALARRLERKALLLADRRVSVTASDAPTFVAWGAPAEVVPTGLDLAALRIDLPVADARRLLNRLCDLPDDETPLFFFLGTRFRPNILGAEAMRDLAARFEREHPAVPARFVVAGSCHAPKRDGRFVALGFIDKLALMLMYRCCAAVLVPLELGTGVSVKTFQALGAGCAIVSTPVGVRGVDLPPGDEAVLVERDLSAWPALLAELLAHPLRLDRMRRASRAFGERVDHHKVYRPYLSYGPDLTGASVRPDPGVLRHRATRLDAAEAALRLDLPDMAAQVSDAVLAEAPTDGRTLLLRAKLSAATDSGARVLAALQAALRQGGDPTATLCAIAEVEAAAGHPAEARAARAEAARFAANRPTGGEGEASLRAEMWRAYHDGDPAWAHAVATEAVAFGGDQVSGDYHYVAGVTELERPEPDLDRAETALRTALARGFDPFWCWTNLARTAALRPGETSADDELFGQALKAAGRDAERGRAAEDAMTAVAWTRFERGQHEQAMTIVRQLLALHPHAPSANYLLAEMLRLGDNRSKPALTAYVRARRLGFDRGWCLTHEAQILGRIGRIKLATERALAAVAAPAGDHSPDAVACLRELAWRAYNGRENARLLALTGQVLDAGIDDAELWYLRGEALRRHGEPAAARAAYDQAAAGAFDRYWTFRRRAEVRAVLGESGEIEDRLEAARHARDAEARAAVLGPVAALQGAPRDVIVRGMAETRDDPMLRSRFQAMVAWLDVDDAEAAGLMEAPVTVPPPAGAADLYRLHLQRASGAMSSPAPPSHGEVQDWLAAARLSPAAERETSFKRASEAAWRLFDHRLYDRTLIFVAALLEAGPPDGVAAGHIHYLHAECLQIRGRALDVARGGYDRALELGFDPFWARFNRAQVLRKLGLMSAAAHDLAGARQAALTAEHRDLADQALRDLAAETPAS